MNKIALVMVFALVACGGSDDVEPLPHSNGKGPAPFDPDEVYAPDVSPAGLSSDITNELFPAPVGATWLYEAHKEGGEVERIEIEVLSETYAVNGFDARVVRDTVYVDGEMIEDTWDWYGQDTDGNVWYVGEDTYEYDNGQVVCACGAWEWGKDVAGIGETALPGVIMLGDPQVGDVYRQEYYAGEAEDLAVIVERDVTVTVPAGTFSGCVKTNDRSAVELDYTAFKYYCPGVGVALEEEDGERVELLEFAGLD